MSNLLDNMPLATLTFLAGVVLIIIGYAGDSITFDEAFKDVLFLGGGAGAVGYVRNQAGKGIRK